MNYCTNLVFAILAYENYALSLKESDATKTEHSCRIRLELPNPHLTALTAFKCEVLCVMVFSPTTTFSADETLLANRQSIAIFMTYVLASDIPWYYKFKALGSRLESSNHPHSLPNTSNIYPRTVALCNKLPKGRFPGRCKPEIFKFRVNSYLSSI